MICSPRAGSGDEIAHEALADLSWPHETLDRVPAWPEAPSAWIGGWYRRSPDHARAPEGVPELIQCVGESFGEETHATTALCLSLLAELPAGPALDAGCGSGLLTQAWRKLGRGPVLAIDLDRWAVQQCTESLAAAGVEAEVRVGALAGLTGEDLGGRVVLANLPAGGHRELTATLGGDTPAALVCGPGPTEMDEVLDAWRAQGLHPRTEATSGRWRAAILEQR